MWWFPVSEAVVDLQHKGSTQQIQRGSRILQGQIKYIHDPGEAISQRIFMYAEFFCCFFPVLHTKYIGAKRLLILCAMLSVICPDLEYDRMLCRIFYTAKQCHNRIFIDQCHNILIGLL